MKIVSAYSIKGGVGKTATAVNLAYVAASRGINTLLIDLDAQAASSFYLRVRPPKKFKSKTLLTFQDKVMKFIRASDYEQLDILPAHKSFRNLDLMLNRMKKPKKRLQQVLDGFREHYDLVVLDATPTISLLAENLFNASDMILVPVVPTTLSQRTYDQLLSFFEKQGYRTDRLTGYFSMVKTRSRLHRDTIEEMRAQYANFLEAQIPLSADVESMGIHREPVGMYAGRRVAAKAYDALSTEILERIGL